MCSCTSFLLAFFVTTWRPHVLLHQRGCFRHSPWLPIADKAGHPPCPRLQPVVESGAVFSGTRGQRSRASECSPRPVRSCWVECRPPRIPSPTPAFTPDPSLSLQLA